MKLIRKAAAALLLCALLPGVAITQTPQRIKINQLPIGTIAGTYITICDNTVTTYACTYNQVAAWFNSNLSLILPSQVGNAGDCLGTNGTTASWISCGGGGGGSGTVNSASSGSIAYYAGTGNTVSGATLGAGLTLNGGVLGASQSINAQTGTSYAVVAGDAGKLLTFSNSSPVAVSLSQAGTAGFTTGFGFDAQNKGLGAVTITPATSTINGAASLIIPHNQGCSITSDGTNYQISACTALTSGGGAGLTNQLDACTYAGIDPTGVADSDAGVQNAFAAISGTNTTLYVNCPIKLTIGQDATKPVFVDDGTNVVFGPSGVFIVDNQYIQAFVFMGTQNSTWVDARFQYVGTLGIANPGGGPSGALNDGRMKTYMSTVRGNTFSGSGSTQYWGTTNACAIVGIHGGQHITFVRPKFFVADGTQAYQFIPVAVTTDYNWTPGTLVTNNNQAINSSNTTAPTDINFINPVIDGAYMGFLGGGSINLVNPKFLRYADLQDSGGNNIGGTGLWFAPPHAVYEQMQDPSIGAHVHITGGDDEGLYVGNPVRRASSSGFILSLKVDLSNGGLVDGYVSHRPDGCVDLLNNYNNPVGGTMRNVTCFGDTSTADGSGNHWVIFRFPSAFPYQNSNFENIAIYDAAATPTLFPFSGPSQSYNESLSITGLRIFQNDWPTGATYYPGPVAIAGNNINLQGELTLANCNSDQTFRGTLDNQGTQTVTNSNFEWKVNGWRQMPLLFSNTGFSSTGGTPAANWGHATGTYKVSFNDGEVRWITLTSGAASAVTWPALTGLATTGASGDGTTATITFANSGAAAPIGSPITISGVTPAGYNVTNVAVTDSTPTSVSYLNATTGNQTVAGTIMPFVNTVAGGALNVNYSGYRQRVLFGAGAKSVGTKAHVIDSSNNWEAVIDGGLETDFWTQTWYGTPVAGATYTLPITFPTNWSIDRWAWQGQVAYTGPTSINVGLVSGSATALMTGAPVTVSSPPFGTPTPVASTGGAILFTAVGSNFTGTGTSAFAVRGSQMAATP